MTTISLQHLKSEASIEAGYNNRALNIPGYGWVPCSRKLQMNFTTSPDELMLVISEPDDEYIPVTSEIWVTRTNIVQDF